MNLPTSWRMRKLSDIATKLKAGGTPSAKNTAYYGGEIPFVKIGDISDDKKYLHTTEDSLTDEGIKNSSTWTVPEGALLYTMYGSYGIPKITKIECATNQAIIAFLPKKELVDVNYIYYYLTSIKSTLGDLTKGTTQQNLNAKIVRNIDVPLPSLNEQKRIVSKIEELFSKLDAGVTELQKGEEKLKQYRLSLLKSAFEGKLSKRARMRNRWEILQDFEEHEEPPNILQIPSEWRWVNVGSVVESLRNGIYKPKEYYNDDGIASLRMYNIEDGQIVWKDVKRMELTDEELQKYRLEPGDLLVNRVNSRELVGKAATIPEGIEDCVFESKNIRVKPTEHLRGEYLGHWFYLFRKRHFMSQVKQTVGQATVTQTQIKQMPIPLAPIAEQDEILEKIERQESILSDMREQLNANLTRADRLRQAILKHAFEGKLVPQDPSGEAPAMDVGDANLEPGEQTTLSEVITDVE